MPPVPESPENPTLPPSEKEMPLEKPLEPTVVSGFYSLSTTLLFTALSLLTIQLSKPYSTM